MKSESLQFEMRHEGRDFLVQYETYSRERNLLMMIVFDGLPIDTVELRDYDARLYIEVKAAIENNACTYWDEQDEKDLIPTLAYQRESL